MQHFIVFYSSSKISFFLLFECFLLGWGGGKTVFKKFLLKCLVWLSRSSCIVSIIISLDFFCTFFSLDNQASLLLLFSCFMIFCLHESGVVCKVKRLFPLVLDVQPPNIYLGAWITPEDIEKAHTPSLNITLLL